jgi:plasmid stability protein
VGQILIRNVDNAVIDVLRGRARQRGSSIEEEARMALAASVGLTREAAARHLNETRARTALSTGPSSLDDLRVDRAGND